MAGKDRSLQFISREAVIAAQDYWAKSIVDISSTFLEGGDYVTLAAERAGELYGYGHNNVLFKPTKAREQTFRPDADGAMSYFVGNDAVTGGFSEDAGFAINGKKGFSKVVFTNHQIDCHGEVALAMGTYDFTCATTGSVTTVEYSFGYKRSADGKIRICLHHSSVPYQAATSGNGRAMSTKAITCQDVIDAQDYWAKSIVDISSTFLKGGDYVSLAAERAGELYGYGHSNVLFKPTKAAEQTFRPDATGAMSYFVGNDAVTGGFSEDAGFAINGKKGFSKVVFKNHQIDCHGEVAVAMGTYDFTCATTRSVTTVEYSFGYKRNADGKVRICLHHSSLPYQPTTSAKSTATTAQGLERVQEVFKQGDRRGDGLIDLPEMKRILKSVKSNLSEQEVADLFRAVDTDGKGVIPYDEFLAFLWGEPEQGAKLEA